MEKARILIVEDEAVNAMSIKRALASCGYEVCKLASTGEEAIKLARQEKPDVILMDILLAGPMDGFEASMEIRSLADTPIVFITGYMDDTILMKANEIECVSLLVKPVEPKDIHLAIAQALERRKK